jgi:MFS family permease
MHMPELTAGAALGLAGGLSLPAALAVGWLADTVGRGRVLAVVYALRGLTYVLLLGATTETGWFLAAFALGLSWSGTVPLSAAIAADAFGRRNLATITGTMVMGMWVASGLAALAAGLIYDHTHSYYLALIGNGLLAFAAASICLGIVGERTLPYARQRSAAAG